MGRHMRNHQRFSPTEKFTISSSYGKGRVDVDPTRRIISRPVRPATFTAPVSLPWAFTPPTPGIPHEGPATAAERVYGRKRKPPRDWLTVAVAILTPVYVALVTLATLIACGVFR